MSTSTYPRFTLAQRVEHWLLVVSFSLLSLTGLPQLFAQAGWAQSLIVLMGGIETVRLIHRAAATVLMLEAVYHLAAVGYQVFVRRSRLSMLPSLGDARDAWNSLRHNLGLRQQPPQAGRYSYGEKIEYWAVVWGTVIMIITGFMLWNPIATARWLPGQVIPAAKAAHGGEALLAVLAIIIWHLYNVHVRHFNRSMLTGMLSEHEMLAEHSRELADIKAGMAAPRNSPAALRRRRQRYLPMAGVLSVVLLLGVYRFVTFEQTALAAVERGERIEVYLPLTATPFPTPLPTATAFPLRPVWAGNLEQLLQQRCGSCHGTAAGLDLASYDLMLAGGQNGPVIVPGDPDNSPLVQKLARRHPGQLREQELQVLKDWIAAGAPHN
jgi:formate dehydrogenase gamma subunit